MVCWAKEPGEIVNLTRLISPARPKVRFARPSIAFLRRASDERYRRGPLMPLYSACLAGAVSRTVRSSMMSADASFIRSLEPIRQRCAAVYALATEGRTLYFELDPTRYDEVVDFCASVIGVSLRGIRLHWHETLSHSETTETDMLRYASRTYPTQRSDLQIPPHSRWRHFATPTTADILQPVIDEWSTAGVRSIEIAKRLIDLFVVSVLLDGTPLR